MIGGDKCKYTGLSADKLAKRAMVNRTLLRRDRNKRRQITQQANETYKQNMVAAFIMATRTPGIKQKGAKQEGAKAVKHMET